jgi:hypothetical protein
MADTWEERGTPPPAPNLTPRGWLRVGVGVCLLAVLAGIGAWVSIGDGRSLAPVYGNGVAAESRTWSWDGRDFTAEPVMKPAPGSSDSAMAYDRTNGVLVLWDHGCSKLVMGFTGGCQSLVNQTWTWAGQAWTRQQSASAPTAVGQGAMLYHTVLGQVLYVNRMGQAWGWGRSGWQVVATGGAPRLAQPGSQDNPALALVAVGYDESRRLLVLALPETTWTWDGQVWSQLSGGIAAADGQSDPRASYDAALGQLVYLGAKSLWSWDGSRWQAHEQPNLGGGTLGYDPIRKNVIVVRQNAAACDGAACKMETWTWDGAAWSTPPVSHEPLLPLSRSGALNPPMAFDEARGRMVLFASAT